MTKSLVKEAREARLAAEAAVSAALGCLNAQATPSAPIVQSALYRERVEVVRTAAGWQIVTTPWDRTILP
jgi:hypothetical protein